MGHKPVILSAAKDLYESFINACRSKGGRAMERSPVRDTEIRLLLKGALTDRVDDRARFMRGVDASFRYEGYENYRTEEA